MNLLLSRGGRDIVDATFRPARLQDTDAMYELSLPFMESGALIVRDRDRFDARIQDFYVVEIDHEIVACAGIQRFSGTAEIFNVAVRQQWQGLGLGRFLVASIVAVLHTEGIGEVLLFSSTSTAWFERCGFVPMDPAALPTERLALLDPARGSIPMSRTTVSSADPLETLGQMPDLRVRFNRSDIEATWESSFNTLLEFTEYSGVEVDSLCWAGICGTCSTRLSRGAVGYHVMPAVGPEDGEVLLCIAQPITDLELEV